MTTLASPPARVVLLVEDNPGDAELVREMLLEDGTGNLELVHVGRLEQAIRRVNDGGVDVIFLDLGLPDATGLDTVVTMRAQAPHVPVVVLTGTDDEAVGQACIRSGAHDYLCKNELRPNIMRRAIAYAVARRDAEKNLQAVQEQLRQAQKMEAIGHLAGGIAHDFNNLLTVILGRAEMLTTGLAAGEPLRKSAETIRSTAERAGRLTGQLLAFSRQQMLQTEVVDLNSVVADMQEMLKRLIGETIEIRTLLRADLGRVRVDRGQLEQVILNLVINARDAMPEGGRLTIETANVALEPHEPGGIEGAPAGPGVVLSVRDSGVGMDAAARARIFEPFFTTKAKGRGTGLGLATVYGIVQQSGGTIGVDSEPGQGATFTIYLPRVNEAVSGAAVEPPAAAGVGRATILLVDDEVELLEMTREILELSGYIVLATQSPAEAIAIAQQHADTIDALVTDVMMPEMDGPTLADRLARAMPRLRVLYTSAYTEGAFGRRHPATSSVAFLRKPFSVAALCQAVRAVLAATPATTP